MSTLLTAQQNFNLEAFLGEAEPYIDDNAKLRQSVQERYIIQQILMLWLICLIHQL